MHGLETRRQGGLGLSFIDKAKKLGKHVKNSVTSHRRFHLHFHFGSCIPIGAETTIDAWLRREGSDRGPDRGPEVPTQFCPINVQPIHQMLLIVPALPLCQLAQDGTVLPAADGRGNFRPALPFLD
jgi:hypothetical protein